MISIGMSYETQWIICECYVRMHNKCRRLLCSTKPHTTTISPSEYNISHRHHDTTYTTRLIFKFHGGDHQTFYPNLPGLPLGADAVVFLPDVVVLLGFPQAAHLTTTAVSPYHHRRTSH